MRAVKAGKPSLLLSEKRGNMKTKKGEEENKLKARDGIFITVSLHLFPGLEWLRYEAQEAFNLMFDFGPTVRLSHQLFSIWLSVNISRTPYLFI